jgi:hypothetical protein
MEFKKGDTIPRVSAILICFTLYLCAFLAMVADAFQTSLPRFLHLV